MKVLHLLSHERVAWNGNPQRDSPLFTGVPFADAAAFAHAYCQRFGIPWPEPPDPRTTVQTDFALHPLRPGPFDFFYSKQPTWRFRATIYLSNAEALQLPPPFWSGIYNEILRVLVEDAPELPAAPPAPPAAVPVAPPGAWHPEPLYGGRL